MIRFFLLLPLLLAPLALADQPPQIQLSRDGQPLLSIILPPNASPGLKASANELAQMLSRMSGGQFKIETGDGSAGIVLGQPSDLTHLPFKIGFKTGPFDREDYVLRSTPNALYLLGASDLALSHAVWDLLYRLGHRQFFPGQTWETIPSTPNLSIEIDTLQSPSFHARRIWYDWGLWGYNDQPYNQWCIRNRAVKGFDLQSGHAYEAIISANKAQFDAHPEYLALVNGERKMRGDVKFCISNPGLRQLVVEYAIRQVKQHPQADSISMEPSDGGNWCECDACAKMGTPSDRALTLANEAAIAINQLGLGEKYVGMYAYNQHCPPPHIKVDPHVIPSATTAFITGGLTFEQVLNGWQAQGATMGVYDYLSVVDWDWNLPRNAKGSRPREIAAFLPRIHKQGVRFYDAESGDCWGPCGLGYYIAGRVLWDISEAQRVDALIDDFLEKCFGPAKVPMGDFYRLINEDTQRRSPSDIVGRMYRDLDSARHAATNPKILARIDDLVLYTRHAELYYAHANGQVSKEEVAKFDYRIRKTMMVHSYGLWCRLLSQKAALTKDHPLKDDRPFNATEIDQIISNGIAKNQPSDPGFATVEFSKNLVPAAPLKLPHVKPGSFPTHPQDHQRYYIYFSNPPAPLDLKVTVQKVWALRPPKISLYSPLEVSLNPVAVFENYKPDGKTYDITLISPHPGLHRLETVDGGDYTRIAFPPGLPISIESGIDTPDVTSHFRGPWTLYFYVPKGTKLIGGWASRIANWAPRISGLLVDPDGKTVLDFAKAEDGYFKAPVPPGQDGKLWKFENSQGQRLLMTVPPYLARSGDELLLPVEVVSGDK
jgi:hypothetical protein